MKVEQRLLFHRIDRKRGGATVAELYELAVYVLADVTEAVLACSDVAMARAEITVNAAVREGLPPARSMNCSRHNFSAELSYLLDASRDAMAAATGRL